MPDPVGTVSPGLIPASPAAPAASAAPPPAPAPAAPPIPPPAPPAPAPPAAPEPGSGNEENKFRRLHEKSEAEKTAALARVAELEAAETKRKQADMSEIDRAKSEAVEAAKRADAAEAKSATLERERMVNAVATEHNLSPEALKLLARETGDEAAIRQYATELVAIMKQPAIAGSNTQPGHTGGVSIDAQIQQAEKDMLAGKPGAMAKSILLKRERASSVK